MPTVAPDKVAVLAQALDAGAGEPGVAALLQLDLQLRGASQLGRGQASSAVDDGTRLGLPGPAASLTADARHCHRCPADRRLPVRHHAVPRAELPAARPGEQFIPIFTGREIAGPAGSVTPAGLIDYLELLNRRDGGVNGVRLTWAECETAFDDARGVACFEQAAATARRSCCRCRAASPTP